jgi:hypothetical protein
MLYEYANLLGAFGAVVALVAIACRADALVWRLHQGRFIVGNMLVACYALSLLLHLWGRDNVDWYSIFGVIAVDLLLINQTGEWKNGVPERMKRTAPAMRVPGPEFSWARLRAVKVPSARVVEYAVPHPVVDVLALLTLVIPLVIACLLYQKGHGQPAAIYSGRADPPAIEVGEKLVIKWDAERFRDCPGEIRQFLLDAQGIHVATLWSRSGGRSGPQPRGVRSVHIDLPELVPGEYFYRANLRSDCPDANYSVWAPDVPFSVVAFKGVPVEPPKLSKVPSKPPPKE